MAFELPALPYAQDALAPHISAETLEYHYGKHHKTYVDNLNKAVAGTADEKRRSSDIIAEAEGGLFNNAAQIWNHTFFWNSLSPTGGGEPTGDIADASTAISAATTPSVSSSSRPAATQFGSGWAWLVDDGGKLADHEHRQRRPAHEARREGAAHHRRVGARLLHRLPQRAAQVPRRWSSTASSTGTSPTRTWRPDRRVGGRFAPSPDLLRIWAWTLRTGEQTMTARPR